ncbi:hypothetical protein PACTADRAFT_48339 [Pachysolen tannophilus NRRL Y-2460]|uniref:Small nuclear ribonucleoprotein Sm D3 n=1 Tax=Pachysolen tannophilus NRRL Y-2460 TaxID=669874 RepID=A0A1E4U3X8_PACTA|nr:hypothetical protein PACTADRAFT_48339 [Pachysolen tannophilus NRRL Y-2460]
MSSSIPVKLLYESQGHVVSIELNNGNIYRGKLIDCEDNMNLSLKNIVLTESNGNISHLDHCFIRGSMIKFISIPEILKNAPMFNKNLVKPNAPIRNLPRRK